MGRLSVAVVGLRGHAGRHIEMLKRYPDVDLKCVYYHREPPPESTHLPITGRFSDCLESDVVIISSPTPAHFQQVEALRDYEGYVLLEKPAVTRSDEIRLLLEMPARLKGRTYVNYNFMFHDLAGLLGELASGPELGDVFALDVYSSHGGAFRGGWHDSWRLGSELNLGALETVGIHFVHFALAQFGECRNAVVRTSSLSREGEAVDTGMVSMRMETGVWVNVCCSYAAPYAFSVQMRGTNGYLTYDGKEATLYSPRDTFAENGLFMQPPVAQHRQIDYEPCWAESLVRSQRHLLTAAQQKKTLDPAAYDRDVSAVKVLLDARRLD